MTKLRTPSLLVAPGKKSRTLSAAVVSAITVAVLTLAAPAIAQNPATASTAAVKAVRRKPVGTGSRLVVIDPANRTVTTSSFSVAWSTSNDTEAITSFIWNGGSNLTNTQGLGTCFPQFPGSVEYFGNSYAPPDPWAGGLVLVGGGTTTPPGTTAWSGQILPSGTAQVVINSSSTDCPPSSAGINVQTTYNFVSPDDPTTTSFGVQRAFDFSTTTFAHDFQPYMARLSLDEGFTEALYPDTSGALATINVYNCGFGCTGPDVIPNATLLTPSWDATQGWFAIHNPTTLQGVVVARKPSVDPQGNPIAVQLWVDNDGGTDTNVTSFLLMYPTGGFTGGLVTEIETLCFYDSSIWTPSITPPAACNGIPTTSTTLTSSRNPSNYGQSVTFTATVTASSGTPTGTVIFYDGSTAIGSATLSNGSASISTSTLPAGSNSITAAYQGSSSFAPSTSAPLIQVVNGAKTTTSLVSSLNPSVFGQTVILTASVNSASGTPNGTVLFYDGSTQIGSATLAGGSASFSTALLAAGSQSITAAYQGSGSFEPSTSAPLMQVVGIATTTTSLVSSVNPVPVHKPVTYTATMGSQYGAAVTGTVAFQDGGATIATISVVNNQAAYTTMYKSPGVHVVMAVYSGDANNTGSTSVTLMECAGSCRTKTTVTTSGSPSQVGQPVTFTATVTSTKGKIPDGELVTFYDGKTVLGSATLANEQATYTTSTLSAKTHTVKAIYPGDGTFEPSTGSTKQVVLKYPTTTSLTSSPNPSNYGQKVTFTATVTPSGSYALTGNVGFYDGTTGIGTATLSGGVATLNNSTLAVGTHSITAKYLGDPDNHSSESPIVEQIVQ